MSRVKIGQFKFGEDEFTLRYVLERDQSIKFVAKDVAASLKYVDCKQAVRINVDDKYKSTFEQGCVPHTPASDGAAKQGDPLCELTSTTNTNLHLSRGLRHIPPVQTAWPSKACSRT
uniref:BRO-B n=1 Tax=Lymantria dispar multicapsid nuclear polyhedrosis virus TaxID=10449 RepID=A0A7S8IX94_NPVLD|nr:BRO-B [Lymantria dispar multiple nucleopolyhedrovirus]QPD01999.1 BRO-B [Lymantria dispar multiple nucleopolyhedrovirus]